MIKKFFSTLLVTSVLAVTIVSPVFAASDGITNPDRPDQSSNIFGHTGSNANSDPNANSNYMNSLFCEVHYSPPGMGYFDFPAYNCSGDPSTYKPEQPTTFEPAVIGPVAPADVPSDIPSEDIPL